VREFVREQFVKLGMTADVCIHSPPAREAGGKFNVHVHVLLSLRSLESNGWGPKQRQWNDKALTKVWRSAWADAVNSALKKAGHDVAVDHRSLLDQGITDRLPTKHLGPDTAWNYDHRATALAWNAWVYASAERKRIDALAADIGLQLDLTSTVAQALADRDKGPRATQTECSVAVAPIFTAVPITQSIVNLGQSSAIPNQATDVFVSAPARATQEPRTQKASVADLLRQRRERQRQSAANRLNPLPGSTHDHASSSLKGPSC
jgi:hypothetical protein